MLFCNTISPKLECLFWLRWRRLSHPLSQSSSLLSSLRRRGRIQFSHGRPVQQIAAWLRMSLIEDLSNPLLRLIVYLCLSLIGLKRKLMHWSIQRMEKSNHCSSLPVFLCPSCFFFWLHPLLLHIFFFSASHFAFPPLPIPPCEYLHMSSSIFFQHDILSLLKLLLFLSFLALCSSPNFSFSIYLSIFHSFIFFTLQSNCNKQHIKSETVSSPDGAAWWRKKYILHAYFYRKETKQLV